MSTPVLTRCIEGLWTIARTLGALLSCTLLLLSCNSSGSGSVSSQTGPGTQVEQQVIEQLLDLYRTAIRQEDIDRLQTLVQSETPTAAPRVVRQQSTSCQAGASPVASGQQFLCAMSTAFRTSTITTFDIVPGTVVIAPDRSSAAFQEVESVEHPATLMQQTRLFHTVLQLARQEAAGLVTFRIVRVQRTGPLVQVSMPSQVQAGAPARIGVMGTVFALAGVEVEVPVTGVRQPLRAEGLSFQGVVTLPQQAPPPPLRVHVRGTAGEQMSLSHVYRLRQASEGAVGHIDGTGTTRFSAITVAADGTVWAGGDGVRLYRIAPGSSTAVLEDGLPGNATGRMEDLVVDQLGRLHIVFIDFTARQGGVLVHDPAHPGLFCQTVNVFDPLYPFRDPRGQLSASTRAIAAEGGDIWLFGSDGGVARVADGFRNGQCPTAGVEVRYMPLFRRADGSLLSNTVPALAVGAGGTLWFGTAFGLTRLRHGQFTPLPFAPELSLRGNVTTLEVFFQEVAQAIFAAQPLTTVQIGEVSFVEEFGSPLVKEDLSFSAVEDAQGRLWLGTFGGAFDASKATCRRCTSPTWTVYRATSFSLWHWERTARSGRLPMPG